MPKYAWSYAALIALLAFVGARMTGAQELTEQAAVARFMSENSNLRALDAAVRVAEGDARRATVRPNPSVTYNREDAARNTDNFVTLQQTLPVNGRLGMLRRAGDASVKAAQADAAYARWSLRANFLAAFYALVLVQEREAGWNRGVSDFEEVVRILRERENAGEGSKFDRLRAERELAEARAQRAAAQADRAEAKARLSAFLAVGTNSSMLVAVGELAMNGSLPSLDELTARALQQRGDHLAEVQRAERYRYESSAAQRERYPDPTLSGGLKHSRTPLVSDSGYAVTLTVPLPVFNRGQADAARARAASDQSLALSSAKEQQIRAEVEGAYGALQVRMQMAQDYGRDLGTAANELSRISRAAYQDGEQTILELLDSYRVALSSSIRHLELQSEARLAEIELERAVGDEVTR